MKFVSTRDPHNVVGFKQAVLDSLPIDGGLYVPEGNNDLKRWIYYADENTTFASLAGALTSAMINEEFSPLVCEAIAVDAFPTDPVFRQLDENLFILELYHGATGTFKDFGVSYLTSALETILTYDDERAILVDFTKGELGACMVNSLLGKRRLKSLLVSPKGKLRGLAQEDFAWNGGNVYPIEIDGTEEDCREAVRHVFSNRKLVRRYNLTAANTVNIGRVLPQTFFYTFAFSRLKKMTSGEIFYALAAGNYGNLVSGLYGWKFSLPVNGFIVPATPRLTLDAKGECVVLDSMIPLEKRGPTDPAEPSNIERLEQIFKVNPLILKSFVYPAQVTAKETADACKSLFMKYKVYADEETSSSYAAALKRHDITSEGEEAIVLVAREDPAIHREFLMHNLGEAPAMKPNVARAFTPAQVDHAPLAPGDFGSVGEALDFLSR